MRKLCWKFQALGLGWKAESAVSGSVSSHVQEEFENLRVSVPDLQSASSSTTSIRPWLLGIPEERTTTHSPDCTSTWRCNTDFQDCLSASSSGCPGAERCGLDSAVQRRLRPDSSKTFDTSSTRIALICADVKRARKHAPSCDSRRLVVAAVDLVLSAVDSGIGRSIRSRTRPKRVVECRCTVDENCSIQYYASKRVGVVHLGLEVAELPRLAWRDPNNTDACGTAGIADLDTIIQVGRHCQSCIISTVVLATPEFVLRSISPGPNSPVVCRARRRGCRRGTGSCCR